MLTKPRTHEAPHLPPAGLISLRLKSPITKTLILSAFTKYFVLTNVNKIWNAPVSRWTRTSASFNFIEINKLTEMEHLHPRTHTYGFTTNRSILLQQLFNFNEINPEDRSVSTRKCRSEQDISLLLYLLTKTHLII